MGSETAEGDYVWLRFGLWSLCDCAITLVRRALSNQNKHAVLSANQKRNSNQSGAGAVFPWHRLKGFNLSRCMIGSLWFPETGYTSFGLVLMYINRSCAKEALKNIYSYICRFLSRHFLYIWAPDILQRIKTLRVQNV